MKNYLSGFITKLVPFCFLMSIFLVMCLYLACFMISREKKTAGPNVRRLTINYGSACKGR